MTPITSKLRENRLRWYRHVLRRPIDALVRKVKALQVKSHRRGRDRPKKCLREIFSSDMSKLGLSSLSGLHRAA